MNTRHKQWLWRTVFLGVAVGVCFYGPSGCGWAATKLAPRVLQRAGITAEIDVTRVGLFTLRADAMQFSGGGWSATSDAARVRYTPLTLLRRRIEAVEVDDVQVVWDGGKISTNTAADAWRDINPAALLAQTVDALRGWRITRFLVLDLCVRGREPVPWQVDTAIAGRMQGPPNELSLTATVAPLSVTVPTQGGQANGGINVTVHVNATGITTARLTGEGFGHSQHDLLPLAGISVSLSFTGNSSEWEAGGMLLCGTRGSQLPAMDVACDAFGLFGMVQATGTTFQACDYDISGGAVVQDFKASLFSICVPEVECDVRLHAVAGNNPKVDGTLSLPLATGDMKTGTAELSGHATFEGVWPFDQLRGSVSTRVCQVQVPQRMVSDPLHGNVQWSVSGLTNRHNMAWQATGSVSLDTAALQALSGVVVDTTNITCDVTASGDASGALRADARTSEAIIWRTPYNGGTVSGAVAAVTGGLTFSSGVARAWAETGALTAAGGGFALVDGCVRLTGETSFAALEAGEWQATADVTARQIGHPGSKKHITAGPLALPMSLSGLHASCKLCGRAATVEAIEDASFGWSELTALGGSWLPGTVSTSITGGVLRAGYTVGLAQSALQAEVACEKLLRPGAGIQVNVRVPETLLCGDDAWLKLVPAALLLEVSEGSFSANVEAGVRPARGFSLHGEARLLDVVLSGQGGAWEARGLGADASFSVKPDDGWQAAGNITAARAAYDKLAATNVVVVWRADPRELFVERAQAGWCGGVVRVFAVHADVRTRRAELTLFIDHVQLADILDLLRAMPGTGEGQLYGRLPLRYESGQVRLSDGFLYSLPGEGGRVQIDDTGMIEEALKRLDPKVRQQVIPALHDLLFSVFRLDLTPPDTPGGDAMLKLRLSGEANKRRDLPPVDLTVNLRGPLEALFNMGMRMGGL